MVTSISWSIATPTVPADAILRSWIKVCGRPVKKGPRWVVTL
jgi:hypothetical protein